MRPQGAPDSHADPAQRLAFEPRRLPGEPDPAASVCEISILPVTQATTATFTNLYFRLAFLVFIRCGSKRVLCPVNGEVFGEAGDLMIFPAGSMVTMENRRILNADYRADGLCFGSGLIDAVFPAEAPRSRPPGVQVLRADPHRPAHVLALIRATLEDEDLPAPIRRHRLLEPLIWLRHMGVRLPVDDERQPLAQVRRLIETDFAHPWRLPEVASRFAMSEATFRRWLAKSGLGFSRILLSARLERGLTLLQTTDQPISRIALDCGFKTPSHFSDAFRHRFGIKPKMIRSRAD